MGTEGIATKKRPKEKTLKVGKRLAAKMVKQREHETKEEAADYVAKDKEGLTASFVDQDSQVKSIKQS